MEKDLIETTKTLSPLIIAGITLISGLISGLVTIYLGPKIKFKYEDRKRKIEYKVEVIKNIRKMLDTATSINDIKASSYWGFISENLSEKEKKIVFSKGIFATTSVGNIQLSNYLIRKKEISLMISRVERNWQLIN